MFSKQQKWYECGSRMKGDCPHTFMAAVAEGQQFIDIDLLESFPKGKGWKLATKIKSLL